MDAFLKQLRVTPSIYSSRAIWEDHHGAECFNAACIISYRILRPLSPYLNEYIQMFIIFWVVHYRRMTCNDTYNLSMYSTNIIICKL